jgi:hypothetical protein
MMHKLTFFPLGNADCCRIDLDDGRKILFDYANVRNPDDDQDKRCDLPTLLLEDLKQADKDKYEVVAFTHLDNDHVCGAPSFFYFEHADKYKVEGRPKIGELWVPAAALVEEGLDDDARVIRSEARYRFKQKKGIRVFSRPDRLKEWMKKEKLDFDAHKHLITDAGQLVPGWSKDVEGVEFFVHSPFAERTDAGEVIDRNDCSLVMQAWFSIGGREVRVMLSADTGYELWEAIVKMTRRYKNDQRLEWDVFKLPHHCSYGSIGPEKGKTETAPTDATKWLFETQAQTGAVVVSTSEPIPSDDSDDQPPHRQAANYYKNKVVGPKNGEFKVTLEHPSVSKPEPLVIKIDGYGTTILKSIVGGGASVVSRAAPRAGATDER